MNTSKKIKERNLNGIGTHENQETQKWWDRIKRMKSSPLSIVNVTQHGVKIGSPSIFGLFFKPVTFWLSIVWLHGIQFQRLHQINKIPKHCLNQNLLFFFFLWWNELLSRSQRKYFHDWIAILLLWIYKIKWLAKIFETFFNAPTQEIKIKSLICMKCVSWQESNLYSCLIRSKIQI